MLEPWINADIQVVDQLSKIVVWNKPSKKMEKIYKGRYELKNILSYVDFT